MRIERTLFPPVSRCYQRGGGWEKSEIRNPKTEGNPKAEIRNPPAHPLTPRRRDSQSFAESSSSLRFSAFLCASALSPIWSWLRLGRAVFFAVNRKCRWLNQAGLGAI